MRKILNERKRSEMKKKLGILLISLLALVGLAACKEASQAESKNKEKQLKNCRNIFTQCMSFTQKYRW